MNIDFCSCTCAAGFWLSEFTLTELSEGGLFNGVFSIHREFECFLLVRLHDGSAAGLWLWFRRQTWAFSKIKSRLMGGEMGAARMCLRSQNFFLFFLWHYVSPQINRIGAVFMELPVEISCGLWCCYSQMWLNAALYVLQCSDLKIAHDSESNSVS